MKKEHKRSYTINHDKFKSWLEKHYGEVRIRGRHMLVNDPDGRADGKPDTSFNLVFWPDGGCYKSWLPPNKSGGIINLIAEAEKVDYSGAIALVCDDTHYLDQNRVHITLEEFKKEALRTQEMNARAKKNVVALPPGFKTFSDSSCDSSLRNRLYDQLVDQRSINPDIYGLGFIESHERTQREKDEHWPDTYARVVIPYYDHNGNVVYWTARDTLGKEPKYWNAMLPVDEEARKHFIGREDAIWCNDWSKHKKLYICEGAFDAMSLCNVGLSAVAIGGAKVTSKQVSEIQKNLKPETIVIAIDNDPTGLEMEVEMAKTFRSRGWRVMMVSPPTGYKDWNELWHAWQSPGPMKAWIESQESSLTVAREVKQQLSNQLRKLGFIKN